MFGSFKYCSYLYGMENQEINIGDEVTPKKHPILKSKVESIMTFAGEPVYCLENGTKYTKNEITKS